LPEGSKQALARSLETPDPNGMHGLAAAIAGHADCIATATFVDFPAAVVVKHGLIALHPDDF
jgi:hypothetical protein